MGKLYYMSVQKKNLFSLSTFVGPGSTSERFQVRFGCHLYVLSALRPELTVISNYYQLVGYERRQSPSYNYVSYI